MEGRDPLPGHYFANINLWDWAAHGDSVSATTCPGNGSLFFVEILLALAGVAIVLLGAAASPGRAS